MYGAGYKLRDARLFNTFMIGVLREAREMVGRSGVQMVKNSVVIVCCFV